jgi:eukaryotic-like serine/threonine-protein kinase
MTSPMPGPSSLKSPPAGGEALDADPRVGTVLAERYRLDALLGEGGMGRVYAAEHVLMRKKLAVKILHRELTSVPEVVARFEREAMAAANIDHPNVAAATDFGKLVDGAVFLVLEYVQGENLRDQIAAGPMAVERALGIARQIASALGSAHALNIVHRDLKPENVMLVDKGDEPDFVKVLDFGIAKVPIGEAQEGGGRPITKVGMVFGTPEYMAPEQALGQNVDGRADLYALGVILYEMLTGVRPFGSQSQVGILGQQLSKPPPSFAERAPGVQVPPSVEQLALKLLQKEASDRFQSAADVVQAIDELVGAPARSGRVFTLTGGSPRAFGSHPDLDSAPDGYLRISAPDLAPPPSGPLPPLPRFPDGPDSWPEVPISAIPSLDAAVASGLPARATLKLPESVAGAAGVASRPSSASAAPRPSRVRDLGTALKRTVDQLSGWVDAERERLPEAVRVPLKDVPARALLAFGLVAGLAVLIGFGALVSALARSHSARTSPLTSAHAASGGLPASSAVAPASSGAASSTPSVAPVAGGAPDAELAAARSGGPAALLKLSDRYPNDTRVMLALAQADVAHHAPAQAVGIVSHMLSIDPALNENPEVASTLWVAVQAPKSENAAFDLLEGPMGPKGADIVYDLSTTRGIAYPIKHRAAEWLHTQAFQKNSSAALNVAVALRFATECSQRYALLLRAKAVGGKRSLVYLKTLESRYGCGRGGKADCNPCLRGDNRLKETIAAVEQRVGK